MSPDRTMAVGRACYSHGNHQRSSEHRRYYYSTMAVSVSKESVLNQGCTYDSFRYFEPSPDDNPRRALPECLYLVQPALEISPGVRVPHLRVYAHKGTSNLCFGFGILSATLLTYYRHCTSARTLSALHISQSSTQTSPYSEDFDGENEPDTLVG